MSNSYLEALTAELRTHGVERWLLDDQGRHYKLRFEWQGKTMMHVFPRSGSDVRGVYNALSDLRKSMGVTRVIRKGRRDRSGARPAKEVCSKLPLEFTVKPNPFQVLEILTKSVENVRCPRLTLAQMAEMISVSR